MTDSTAKSEKTTKDSSAPTMRVTTSSENSARASSKAIEFDGQQFAAKKKLLVHKKVVDWKARYSQPLTMVSIYPQEDPASILYTHLKKQDAEDVGIVYQTKPMSLKSSRHDWLRAVIAANQDERVHALLVQKPARRQYQKYATSGQDFVSWWQNISEAIDIKKDVDGLAPLNLWRLQQKASLVLSQQQSPLSSLQKYLLPATAQAVIEIALQAGGGVASLRQLSVAVVGQSVIVGQPAAAGLRVLGVPVKLLTSQHDLSAELPSADVIISATGRENLIQSSWIKSGAILIDVGSPAPEFSSDCYSKASFYTPVPYGVGPVTRACLLENIFKL